MKHVKLFEQFTGTEMRKNDIHIGFYADGGYGSHPGVITSESAKLLEESFFTTSLVQEVPEALACMYDDYMGVWEIKGITNSLANSIMEIIGGDHITTDQISNYPGEEETVKNAIEMSGMKINPDYDVVSFSVIPNVSLDTIYWSDEPESAHTQWEPPYKAIPVKKLISNN